MLKIKDSALRLSYDLTNIKNVACQHVWGMVPSCFKIHLNHEMFASWEEMLVDLKSH